MPWVNIVDSGIPYTFGPGNLGGVPVISGAGVFNASSTVGGKFTIPVTGLPEGPVQFRVISTEYTPDDPLPGGQPRVRFEEPNELAVQILNTSLTPATTYLAEWFSTATVGDFPGDVEIDLPDPGEFDTFDGLFALQIMLDETPPPNGSCSGIPVFSRVIPSCP